MPRQKLSEFRSKKIVSHALRLPYIGWSINDPIDDSSIDGDASAYVVKVDQAVKGRFKKGLVLLDVKKADVKKSIEQLRKKGYSSFIIEPYLEHSVDAEWYLAINLTREGYVLSYSANGGVDIESYADEIKTVVLDDETQWQELAHETGLTVQHLQDLLESVKKNYISFLEINPYLMDDKVPVILDCAIEVDDAGGHFTNEWNDDDMRSAVGRALLPQEQEVRSLDANSAASFNLSVLNQDGSVFLLLSGGGASVVIADEVYNRGMGKLLANYGEYSGNPNTEETYLYTKQVITLLIASRAPHKVLFIGGAVANFTDIADTFAGVMQAIEEYADELILQGVRIFVRRGGPRQEIGLAKIRNLLEQKGLLGGVYDPSTSITDALHAALEGAHS